MPSIQLQALSLDAPDGRTLFDRLDLTFGPLRTGLVGRNGTGKTTLLRVIAGELPPRSGSVAIDGRIGVLRQTVQAGDATIAEALGIGADLARLARIEAGAAQSEDLARADWTLPGKVARSLGAAGLPDLALDRAVSTLSGGQRTRLSLAALLLEAPDFLLLDEPTNNLDADGRAAVPTCLARGAAARSSSAMIAIVARHGPIVELTSLGAKLYGGNWEPLSRAQDPNSRPPAGSRRGRAARWRDDRKAQRRASGSSAAMPPAAARRRAAASRASCSAARRTRPRRTGGEQCPPRRSPARHRRSPIAPRGASRIEILRR